MLLHWVMFCDQELSWKQEQPSGQVISQSQESNWQHWQREKQWVSYSQRNWSGLHQRDEGLGRGVHQLAVERLEVSDVRVVGQLVDVL